MSGPFRAEDLRAFLGRGWAATRESKQRAWAVHSRMHGAAGGFRVSQELWAHARGVDPSWPDVKTRQEDFEHHLAVVATLDRLRHVELPR